MLARLSTESAEYAVLKSEVHVLKGFIDMAVGRPDSGIAHAQSAMSYLPKDALLIRSLGILTLAVCHQMADRHDQAVEMVQEELSDLNWPANVRARIHFYLAIALYLDADLIGAMSASRECLHTIRNLSFIHTRTFAEYMRGAAHYWRNEFDLAEPLLSGVLDERHAANPSYLANTGFILASIYLSQDRETQAVQVLDQIIAHCLENGHKTRAREHCRNRDFDVRPPIWFFYVPQLTPIKWLLAEGTCESVKEAQTRLIEIDEQMCRINRKSVRIDVLALLALVYRELDDEEAALEKLRAALDMAEPGGWVRNFVDLGAPMTDLLERLNQAKLGHTYAQLVLGAFRAEAGSSLSSGPSGQAPGPVLTQREIDTLPLVAEGLSNKQIAEKLCISTVTVKTHLQNIYRKLDAGGRIQAIKKARELSLIKDD